MTEHNEASRTKTDDPNSVGTPRSQLLALNVLSRAVIGSFLSTLKVEVSGEEHMDAALRSKRPIVVALYHDNVFGLLRYRIGTQVPFVLAMISRSSDGDFGVAIASPWGVGAVRASSSRGGAAGLIQMCHRLDRQDRPGQSMVSAMALDGPRGPRHESKPGTIAMAERTGALIVPVATDCTPKITLRSWDQQPIPLPFARCSVQFGRPIAVGNQSPEGTSYPPLDAASFDSFHQLSVEQLDQAMARVVEQCQIN